MKFMMISDIHGDYSALKRVLDVYDQGDFDKLVILGDILYHGPRNDLPEGYAPKKCIPLLNAHKNDIIAVRGNCDAEVDQMVLEFPMRADYLEMFVDGHRFYLTHGHLYNETNFPHLNAGDVYCFGHFHIPLLEKENNYYKVNPNSISLPKKGVQSYIVYHDETLSLYDLDHQLIDSLNITKG